MTWQRVIPLIGVCAVFALVGVLASCGGSRGGSNGANAEATPEATKASEDASTGVGLPSGEVATTWPTKWCRAQIGWTREQMRALMGEPTEEYTPENTPSGFDPQMVWEAYEYHFTAFFNADDRVRQLDINDIDLSPEEKGSLECDTTRT